MKKHGASYTAEYTVWRSMRARCRSHPRYVSRGITVCKRWDNFSLFLADVGLRPSSKHTLERVNNNKGYEPSNIVWATMAEQHRNRENNIRVTYEGVEFVLKDLCQKVGRPYTSVKYRLKVRKWPIEMALWAPPTYSRHGATK